MRWPTSRSPSSSLTEPVSATRPGSLDGGVGLGAGAATAMRVSSASPPSCSMNALTLATHWSVPSGQYFGAMASTETRPAPW